MLRIFTTNDGSTSLKDERINETYHSDKGAAQESMHVFIQNGLFHQANGSGRVLNILEMGFGTGLNALLSFIHRPPHLTLDYTSVEAFPVQHDLLEKLNYSSFLQVNEQTAREIMLAPYNIISTVDACFLLHKVQSTFQAFETDKTFDLVYYDAFGPKIQPELWDLFCMEKCYRLLRPGGVLVTYCAQGQFRRNLKAAGFTIEKLAGPPGKREITRATKPFED